MPLLQMSKFNSYLGQSENAQEKSVIIIILDKIPIESMLFKGIFPFGAFFILGAIYFISIFDVKSPKKEKRKKISAINTYSTDDIIGYGHDIPIVSLHSIAHRICSYNISQ